MTCQTKCLFCLEKNLSELKYWADGATHYFRHVTWRNLRQISRALQSSLDVSYDDKFHHRIWSIVTMKLFLLLPQILLPCLALIPIHNRQQLMLDCPLNCPSQSSPVCGSDGQNYDNVCKMLQNTCLTGREVTLSHVGKCGVPEPCPSFCPTDGELQFCGDDGVTYQRWLTPKSTFLQKF